MTAITRSLLSSAALLLSWDRLNECESEDELRLTLMGAFLHTREAHLSLILRPEADPPSGFDKRLDLYLLPSWPPRQPAIAAGELKFFRRDVAKNYRTRMGDRLSDVHYVHSLAGEAGLHGFFFDVALNPELVGRRCYDSLKDMCQAAADALYDPINPLPPDQLNTTPGVSSFAKASRDRTPRKLLSKMDYGFLFPPMDLPGKSNSTLSPARSGPAFVGAPNQDGLISIGVRKSGVQQGTSYRSFETADNTEAAVCFAVFEPGGKLVADTDDLISFDW